MLKKLLRPSRGSGFPLVELLLCVCLALGVGIARAQATPSLPELRAKADKLRAKLDAQNQRLEVIAEDLDAAYKRGTKLLAESTALAKRRDAAQRAVMEASADPAALTRLKADRVRLDSLERDVAKRLGEQARLAMRLKAQQDEARKLIADVKRELRTIDHRIAKLIAGQQQRKEAERQAPHTGAVVRTASVCRNGYAGAVRPVAAP